MIRACPVMSSELGLARNDTNAAALSGVCVRPSAMPSAYFLSAELSPAAVSSANRLSISTHRSAPTMPAQQALTVIPTFAWLSSFDGLAGQRESMIELPVGRPFESGHAPIVSGRWPHLPSRQTTENFVD